MAVVVIMAFLASQSPKSFSPGTTVHIEKNSGLTKIASLLLEKHIISSPFLFKASVVLLDSQRSIVAGDYLFKEPQSVWKVASRMAQGDHGIPIVKVTFPEGITISNMAVVLLKNIPNFNAPYFTKLAKGHEGYLFPDTYFFYTTTKAHEVFDTLRENFDIKIKSLTTGTNFATSTSLDKRTMKDIVTMASIVEKEATSTKDRATIAGILWKRLDKGMLLQVDPPLAYITPTTNGFISLEITKIDSPYNTYIYKGLPSGPISNPGVDALKATLNPVASPYFYYLSDKKGNIHYATTYEGHLKNKERYMR